MWSQAMIRTKNDQADVNCFTIQDVKLPVTYRMCCSTFCSINWKHWRLKWAVDVSFTLLDRLMPYTFLMVANFSDSFLLTMRYWHQHVCYSLSLIFVEAIVLLTTIDINMLVILSLIFVEAIVLLTTIQINMFVILCR